MFYSLVIQCLFSLFFFFFNDTATTEIYPLSLHDALPICRRRHDLPRRGGGDGPGDAGEAAARARGPHLLPGRRHPADRSEEHTSELQSRLHLVCRLLLEKKKQKKKRNANTNDED